VSLANAALEERIAKVIERIEKKPASRSPRRSRDPLKHG
jgi:hypothetical protein